MAYSYKPLNHNPQNPHSIQLSPPLLSLYTKPIDSKHRKKPTETKNPFLLLQWYQKTRTRLTDLIWIQLEWQHYLDSHLSLQQQRRQQPQRRLLPHRRIRVRRSGNLTQLPNPERVGANRNMTNFSKLFSCNWLLIDVLMITHLFN